MQLLQTVKDVNSLFGADNGLTIGKIIVMGIFILLAIPTTIISVYYFIKKLNIQKIGPVERIEEQQEKFIYEFQKMNEERNLSFSEQHFMDDENKENDEHLKERCQERTINMRLLLQNELAVIIDDPVVVSAICVHFRATFSNAIIKNHFTLELRPERCVKYRERLLTELSAEYVNIFLLSEEKIPKIDASMPIIDRFLDSWISMVKDEVCTTCREKIAVYERYKPKFEVTQNLKDIVDWCIKKNQDYIRFCSV